LTQKPHAHRRAILALIVLSSIWGYNWVVMKEALTYSGPFEFAALRILLGAVSLFCLLLLERKSLRPKKFGWTVLLGLLQSTGFIGFAMWALVEGGAGKTAVLVYTMPLWVLLLAWPVMGEHVKGMQWVGIALACAGLLGIMTPWRFQGGTTSELLAVSAGALWGAGAILAKVMHRRTEFDLLSLTAWQMLLGSVPLIALVLIRSPIHHIVWSPYFIGALLYNAIPGNAIAFFLWLYILRELPAGPASLGTLFIPVIGVLAGRVQLGERPDPWEAAGMGLIIAALALISHESVKAKRDGTSSGSEHGMGCAGV
jgi:drug/metabolite transporter (DMT)-like permease